MSTVSVTQHKPYTLVGSLGCPGYLVSLSPVFTQLCVFLPLQHGSLEGSTALLYESPLAVVCPLPGDDSHISDYVKYIFSLMPPQMHNIMSKMRKSSSSNKQIAF